MIKSLSMMNFLCNNGFQVLKVEDNEDDSRYKVFLFEDTTELRNMMRHFPKKEV